eukprot:Lithocolla_globosa_v1_NODE_6361_length_1098_cov_2.378715.p3 type:complete len:111 gc:universal NODE_6361_length_1098_cov_2.378715:915-583(-)
MKEEQRTMTDSKSNSRSLLAGCCRTAKMSTHTKRLGSAQSDAAATRSPKSPPQVCETKVEAFPVSPAMAGRSTYRHLFSNVWGMMILRTTSHVGIFQQLLSVVHWTSQPI